MTAFLFVDKLLLHEKYNSCISHICLQIVTANLCIVRIKYLRNVIRLFLSKLLSVTEIFFFFQSIYCIKIFLSFFFFLIQSPSTFFFAKFNVILHVSFVHELSVFYLIFIHFLDILDLYIFGFDLLFVFGSDTILQMQH